MHLPPLRWSIARSFPATCANGTFATEDNLEFVLQALLRVTAAETVTSTGNPACDSMFTSESMVN